MRVPVPVPLPVAMPAMSPAGSAMSPAVPVSGMRSVSGMRAVPVTAMRPVSAMRSTMAVLALLRAVAAVPEAAMTVAAMAMPLALAVWRRGSGPTAAALDGRKLRVSRQNGQAVQAQAVLSRVRSGDLRARPCGAAEGGPRHGHHDRGKGGRGLDCVIVEVARGLGLGTRSRGTRPRGRAR